MIEVHSTSSGVVFTLCAQRDDTGDHWPQVVVTKGQATIGPPVGTWVHCEPYPPSMARTYSIVPDAGGAILCTVTYPASVGTARVTINNVEYTVPDLHAATVQTIDLPAWCAADYLCTGFASGDSIDAFTRDWEAGNPNADFLQTGFVNADSYDAFVLQWEKGC